MSQVNAEMGRMFLTERISCAKVLRQEGTGIFGEEKESKGGWSVIVVQDEAREGGGAWLCRTL